MKNNWIIWTIVVLVILAAIGLYFFSSGYKSTNSNTTPSAPATPGAVNIQNFAFDPKEITVKKGDTVTWTNNDQTTHKVVSDNGTFTSGNMQNGSKFEFTFSEAGTYTYHCGIHPSMTGSITVQ